MAIYQVFLPAREEEPSDAKAALKNFENAKFVRDGGALLALLFPIVWLVWNRLWYAVAVYALFTLFVFTLGQTGWAAGTAAISFLPGLYLFLEGRNLITAKLRRSGWVLHDVVDADNLADAELKFFGRLEEAAAPVIEADSLKTRQQTLSPYKKVVRAGDSDFGMFAES